MDNGTSVTGRKDGLVSGTMLSMAFFFDETPIGNNNGIADVETNEQRQRLQEQHYQLG